MEFGILYVIGMIFLFILAILWVFLPFAIFGTQPKIDKLLVEAKSANRHLADIREELVPPLRNSVHWAVQRNNRAARTLHRR
jgi:hypothetical protein